MSGFTRSAAALSTAVSLLALSTPAAVASSGAAGGTYRMSFTMAAFGDDDGVEAPQAEVSGVLTYRAAAINAVPDELTGVSLTIDGHSYALADVGLMNFGWAAFVGGAPEVDGLSYGTPDFIMQISEFGDRTKVDFFSYTSASTWGIWDSFTTTHLEVSAVPEASTWAMLSLGLLGVASRARRQRPA